MNRAEIYNKHGINFGTLKHLEDIGLVQFAGPNNFGRVDLPKRFDVHYYGRWLRFGDARNDDWQRSLTLDKYFSQKSDRNLRRYAEASLWMVSMNM